MAEQQPCFDSLNGEFFFPSMEVPGAGKGYFPSEEFDLKDGDTTGFIQLLGPKFSPKELSPATTTRSSPRRRPWSTISTETQVSCYADSTWSPVQTDAGSDSHTIRADSRGPSPSHPPPSSLGMVCLGPQCNECFASEDKLQEHVKLAHTHTCKWAGCGHPSFAAQEGLVWHVQSVHLLICPCKGCDAGGFEDKRLLANHITVAHPEVGRNGAAEWQLTHNVGTMPQKAADSVKNEQSSQIDAPATTKRARQTSEATAANTERISIEKAKRKYQERLQTVVDKRARKVAKHQTSCESPPTSTSPRYQETSPGSRVAGPHNCDRISPSTNRPCKMSFALSSDLARHEDLIHRADRLRCGICVPDRTFGRSEALARHYRSSHPQADVQAFLTPHKMTPTSPSSSGNGQTPRSPSSTRLQSQETCITRQKDLNGSIPFPLVFEHAVLPFLADFLPRWTGPEHVVSVVRGKNRQARRICIMTPSTVSRTRKIIVAGHVTDLLPESHRPTTSFVFSVGEVEKMATWARGINRENIDDICIPRNPFFFPNPCMGDSIGISGTRDFEEATATLGPCLNVGGGSYWLANFHPFHDAYQCAGPVVVEHPSAQDREHCVVGSHDAVSQESSFRIGDVQVTSGLHLNTTRVSHDPYWEENFSDPPLVVTDWALINSRTSHANILRRFPTEYHAPSKEPLIQDTSPIVPGATVLSSGRTSGYQVGQVCEIPAYVSGKANGTEKATREWYIEEPYASDNEEAWIRGGIGVHGDSGAAVIDSETKSLVGQIWGRNKYWGPGPRHAFFTPIADIFDDIQEKCGQQSRPQLPQDREEGDCYPVLPPCRQCYDMYLNLGSRRSSRMSLQSMVMGTGEDGEQDATSIEAVSELSTPPGPGRYKGQGLEEIGMSFDTVVWSVQTPSRLSQGLASPGIAEVRSPYAQELELELELDDDLHGHEQQKKTTGSLGKRRSATIFGAAFEEAAAKRQRL